VGSGGLAAKQRDIEWLIAMSPDTSQHFAFGSTASADVTITDVIKRLQGDDQQQVRSSGAVFYEVYDPSRVTGYSFINVFGTGTRTVHYYSSTDCTRMNSDTVAEIHSKLAASYQGITLYSDTMEWADWRYANTYKDYSISGEPQAATISTKHVCYDGNNPNTYYINSAAAKQV
jgi:hypothetical protein